MNGCGSAARWLVLATIVATPVRAQVAPDIGRAVQESERIQREQEQRRQEQIQRDREAARPPAQLEAPAPPPPAAAPSAVCRDIRVIELDGAKRLGESEQRRLIRPYLNRCLAVGDIERLLGDITKAYIDKGYAAVRVYVPAQDLGSGTLRLLVVEGQIGRIEIEGRKNSIFIAGAFPNLVGKPLNLRDLEQGIDQVNRLSSNNARLDIRPGERPGDSIVVIANQPTRRIYGALSADNLGSGSTGRNQAALTATAEHLLGLNELISITRRQSKPFNDGSGSSSSENYFVSIPYGYATFSAGLTNSRYDSEFVTPGGQTLELSGDSRTAFGALDLVLHRGLRDRLGMTATLMAKDSENFIAGQRLDVSSRKLSVFDLDLNYSSTALGPLLSAGVGYSRGLTLFGALTDPDGLPADAPRAQFGKWRFTAGIQHGFTVAGQRLDLSSQFAAQIAEDPLYGSEQFSIGGVYSVRGFRDSTLVSDDGFYVRNQLSLTHRQGPVLGQDTAIRPYLGLDVGRVYSDTDGALDGTLAGAAAGASLFFGPAFIDIFAARRLAAPDGLENEGLMVFGRFSVRL